MSKPTCPKCGEVYLYEREIDARPQGALFTDYVHDTEELRMFDEVTESCHVVTEWGDESGHDGGDGA